MRACLTGCTFSTYDTSYFRNVSFFFFFFPYVHSEVKHKQLTGPSIRLHLSLCPPKPWGGYSVAPHIRHSLFLPFLHSRVPARPSTFKNLWKVMEMEAETFQNDILFLSPLLLSISPQTAIEPFQFLPVH